MKRLQPPPLKSRKVALAGIACAMRLDRLGFGYPAPLATVRELLAKPERTGCRLTAEIHGPQPYDFASPDTPSPPIADEFAKLQSGTLPPFQIVTFQNATLVSKNLLLIPAGGDCVVQESVITPERFDRTRQQDALKLRTGRRMRGEFFLAIDRWSANYFYHWMVETLCRFLALERLSPDVRPVLPQDTAPYMLRALKLIGVAPGRCVAFDNRRWIMDTCHLATKPYRGFTCSPAEVCELRNRFLQHAKAAADAPAGVYISRGKCANRRLPNEEALSAMLRQRGIATVYAEDLDLDEKIALFSQVKTVVAPFGSGLANLLFCRPGTRVVCLYDEEFFDECVYTLAEALSLPSVHLPLAADGAAPLDLVADALAC